MKTSNQEFFHEVPGIFSDTETTSNARSKLPLGEHTYIQDKYVLRNSKPNKCILLPHFYA